MDLQQAIRQLVQGNDLSREATQDVTRLIMQGEATSAQIGAFLAALAAKGETVEEIIGAATIMRELAAKVDVDSRIVVDTVGTGGDGAKLFNVSTASAFVAAAAGASAGATVAKHGNRAATGNSGSADVLEAAGVDISITPEQVGHCIEEVGIGFMFAPTHHAATRHAIGPRKEIGVRTVFNLLGPLTNPAGARHQLVGVFSPEWVRPLAEVFGKMGSLHTVVVSSDDGLDEISIAADTRVAEYQDDEISEFVISPEQFGISRRGLDELVVENAEQSLALMRSALQGEPGPAFDMVALNAGATIYAADLTDSLEEGVNRAREILQSGTALEKLDRLADFTSRLEAS